MNGQQADATPVRRTPFVRRPADTATGVAAEPLPPPARTRRRATVRTDVRATVGTDARTGRRAAAQHGQEGDRRRKRGGGAPHHRELHWSLIFGPIRRALPRRTSGY
ncbi:hypothetical protein ACIPPS_19235 [Streptomyces sp. NPDC090127]|uniref:hypothetical protein n=1 Tax=Streptomyces sp. NPDC090127 TaxID=3365953 RepID=UPI0038174B0D